MGHTRLELSTHGPVTRLNLSQWLLERLAGSRAIYSEGVRREGSWPSPPRLESETGCVEPVYVATVASATCPRRDKATVPQEQAGGSDSCKGEDSDTEAANRGLLVLVMRFHQSHHPVPNIAMRARTQRDV